MVVRFTDNNKSFANRIIQSSLFVKQSGAILKAYLNAVGDAQGVPDDTASQLFEGPITLLGFSFGLTFDDTPTEATLNFRLSDSPTKLPGMN